MLTLKSILKDAIIKASEAERSTAAKFAQAVLERDREAALPAAGRDDEIARQETALAARQRTVDLLKVALLRLPEETDTY